MIGQIGVFQVADILIARKKTRPPILNIPMVWHIMYMFIVFFFFVVIHPNKKKNEWQKEVGPTGNWTRDLSQSCLENPKRELYH